MTREQAMREAACKHGRIWWAWRWLAYHYVLLTPLDLLAWHTKWALPLAGDYAFHDCELHCTGEHWRDE